MNGVVVTRKRIKNAYIRVKPDGTVSVSAPLGMTDRQIEEMLLERKDWIDRQMKKASEVNDDIHLWGEKVELNVTHGNAETKVISFRYYIEGSVIQIWLSRQADEEELETVLQGIYRAETERRLKELIPEAEARTGLHAEKWTVKNMKSRWGSCKMSEKKIAISSRLAAYPEECLMSVMIHELCHLKVSGHGREFYELMESFYPDWRRVRNILKERY